MKEHETAGKSQGYALFDLDHTIVPFDTQVFFANYILKQEGWRRIYLLWFALALPLCVLRILDLRKMKRLFFSCLWRMPKDELRGHLENFLDNEYFPALYPEVVAEVNRHRSAGRITILNSASPEFYVEDIAKRLGFDHFIGTNLLVEDPMPFLPAITGPNNKKEAKITAMIERKILPPDFQAKDGEKLPDSWAYSDSPADIPLLSIAENGVMIHPGDTLRQEGESHQWTTLTPDRPYAGKWGAKLTTLKQVLGLWPLRSHSSQTS